MDQRLRLIRDRTRQPGVRVAERGDADSREQVEVFAPLCVVEPNALPPHEGNRRALVDLQNVSRLACLNLVDGGRFHKLSGRTKVLRYTCVLVAQVFRPARRGRASR